MKHNGVPENSEYVLIGGTVFLKIPPNRLEHLEIEHIKNNDEPDRLPAKIQSEINQEGEKYQTHWNPNADSQQR